MIRLILLGVLVVAIGGSAIYSKACGGNSLADELTALQAEQPTTTVADGKAAYERVKAFGEKIKATKAADLPEGIKKSAEELQAQRAEDWAGVALAEHDLEGLEASGKALIESHQAGVAARIVGKAQALGDSFKELISTDGMIGDTPVVNPYNPAGMENFFKPPTAKK